MAEAGRQQDPTVIPSRAAEKVTKPLLLVQPGAWVADLMGIEVAKPEPRAMAFAGCAPFGCSSGVAVVTFGEHVIKSGL